MVNPLSKFHPLVADWFRNRFGEPTEVQVRAWQAIARGDHVLMTAPTGSGKTLAAFLWALNRLISAQWEGGCTRVLYVSPLKALNNDVQRNLLKPLSELQQAFSLQAEPIPRIRVCTRSGDTSQTERRRMLRHPPEILITTPESLNLLLSSVSGRAALLGLKTVILDEIHSILDTRRGTFLITAVERLVRLAGEFQRIALSATLKPLDTAARFVGGLRLQGQPHHPVYFPRPVVPIEAQTGKPYNLQVTRPAELKEVIEPHDYWLPFAWELRKQIETNRSTLVFTNSRRLCEKLTYLINQHHMGQNQIGLNLNGQNGQPRNGQRQGDLLAYAHHGSLSREIRMDVEKRMKAGGLRAIVATGSLELGIDIGALDEAILVQSPPSVAEAAQRIGRAGHRVGQTSRGTFYPSHVIDTVSAAVLVRAVEQGAIESLRPIQAPLDVLAQVLISISAHETWNPDDLFNFIRTAYPYHELTRVQFDRVLAMLEGRFNETRVRQLQPKIHHDRLDHTIRAKKGALLALYASGGVIPDRGYYSLRLVDSGTKIGELDEEFVWEARVGQVFTLGTQNWRIHQITPSDVLVSPAAEGNSAPPFWRAENQSREFHLSEKIGEFLEMADMRLRDPQFAIELVNTYRMHAHAAEGLIADLVHQRIQTGCCLPHRHHLVIEYTTMGPGGGAGRQVVWHTLWGGRVNRPLAIALAATWQDRWGSPPDIFVTNDCLSFVLPRDIPAAELVGLVTPDNLDDLLQRRLAGTGYFAARFRECAGRALLIPRRQVNQRMPLWLTRLRAQKLLAAVAAYPDFPILEETWRTCLQDEFDLPTLRHLLNELTSGTISWSRADTSSPSLLARNSAWQSINAFMYQSDQPAPAGSGRLNSDLVADMLREPGLRPQIDPGLIRQFESKQQRIWPGYAPASSEDLLDWTKERLAIPLFEWQALLEAVDREHGIAGDPLVAPVAHKLVSMRPLPVDARPCQPLIVARENIPRLLNSIYSNSSVQCTLLSGDALVCGTPSDDSDDDDEPIISRSAQLIAEWARFYGPFEPAWIADVLGLPQSRVQSQLEFLVDSQQMITGPIERGPDRNMFCDRENFEILLRLSRKAAAPSFEPLETEQLPLFLAVHQGLMQQGQGDIDKLAQHVNRLLCRPVPAAILETEILPARMPDYQSNWLDQLMQEGELLWIGSAGHQVMFCYQHEMDLVQELQPMQNGQAGGLDTDGLTDLFPDAGGRYPFSALQLKTGKPSADLHKRLWQAVWSGQVTNDTFTALRRGIETRFKMPTTGTEPSADIFVRRTGRLAGRASLARRRESRPAVGNWFRLIYPDSEENLLDREERHKERVRVLLDRYGIVFRELLNRELPMFSWPALFRSLRLMELSGEVLAGYFFKGLNCIQFMSLQAFERLGKPMPRDLVFWLNAADPISLCGLGLDQLQQKLPRRLIGNHFVYHGSKLVVISQQQGRRLTIHVPADHPCLKKYFEFLLSMLTRPVLPLRHIEIHTINDQPAALSKGYLDVLQQMFDTVIDHKHISLYRRY